MNEIALKGKQRVVLIVIALGWSINVFAHNQIGTLGDPASATDFYMVQCSTDSGGVTGRLYTQILDGTTTAGGGKISVVSEFNGDNIIDATTASAPVRDGQNGPASILPGADGIFLMFVHKLKEGVKDYNVTYHCQSSEGVHTGTSIQTIQDQ
ncbi:hypothetical conserved protein [Candidatus Nitrosoglobus terrae]|uniref:Hypothetical conserved protein n=1 Tax=Candidatus Nitrosoglobus terrae TaxID=1630141 RepID=A0A1Q2SM44_9GAMM|nr:hypothetical protein [Candidatus Nitrosoglobus terrae]BAW80169.1 hypothetical conserved protein [Candidatus Nitrosoglobus terrae]